MPGGDSSGFRASGPRTEPPAVAASPSGAAAVAAAIAVVGITYWRSWYGVDLTDESFYVVLP